MGVELEDEEVRPDVVTIYRDTARDWRWHRKSPNGRILADSGEGYKNEAECIDMAIRVNGDSVTYDIPRGD